MRYFFNVEGEEVQDFFGLDLPNLDAVKIEANHHARDILHDHVTAASHCERFVLVVTDEGGLAVWSLNFSASDAATLSATGN